MPTLLLLLLLLLSLLLLLFEGSRLCPGNLGPSFFTTFSQMKRPTISRSLQHLWSGPEKQQQQ
jgi:hypothetical protein